MLQLCRHQRQVCKQLTAGWELTDRGREQRKQRHPICYSSRPHITNPPAAGWLDLRRQQQLKPSQKLQPTLKHPKGLSHVRHAWQTDTRNLPWHQKSRKLPLRRAPGTQTTQTQPPILTPLQRKRPTLQSPGMRSRASYAKRKLNLKHRGGMSTNESTRQQSK